MTVSTAGLTADAGAEGAVQIQFVTKRGTQRLPRPDLRSRSQNDKLNAKGAVNKSRGIPKTKLRQHEYGAQRRRPDHPQQAVLLRQLRADLLAERDDARRGRCSTPRRSRASSATAPPTTRSAPSTCSTSRARTACRRTIDPYVASQLQIVNSALGQGNVARADDALSEHVPVHQPADPRTSTSIRRHASTTRRRRVSGDPRRAEPAVARPADQPAATQACRDQRRVHLDLLHPLDRRRLDDRGPNLFNQIELRRAEQLRGVQPRQHAGHLRAAGRNASSISR